MWLLTTAMAAEPSTGARIVTGGGLIVGGVGIAAMGLGTWGLATSPEPYGAALFIGSGATFTLVGSGLSLGGSLAQAHRVGASPTAGRVGLGLLGGSVALGCVSALSGDERVAIPAIVAGEATALGSLVLASVQGAQNWRTWTLVVVPDPVGHGVQLAGAF